MHCQQRHGFCVALVILDQLHCMEEFISSLPMVRHPFFGNVLHPGVLPQRRMNSRRASAPPYTSQNIFSQPPELLSVKSIVVQLGRTLQMAIDSLHALVLGIFRHFHSLLLRHMLA